MRSDFAGLVPDIAAAGRAPKAQHNDSSDAALIAKVATGNRLAMQVLFARHHARVYRFIFRLLGSEAAAEDLTSEVFLGVWRHAHRFEARSSVTTWLLAIARYKALAELRRRPELACDEAAAQTSDPADDPEATFAIKHRGEIVRDCLGRLSRRHREVIDRLLSRKIGAGGRRDSRHSGQYGQNPHVSRPQESLRAARRAWRHGRAGVAQTRGSLRFTTDRSPRPLPRWR